NPAGIGVIAGGTRVFVSVGASVGGGGAQLPEIDVVVPSELMTVAVRLDPAGPVIPRLLSPMSENGASVGPSGITLYVPVIVVPGLADDSNVKTAFPFASRAHVTSRAPADCV